MESKISRFIIPYCSSVFPPVKKLEDGYEYCDKCKGYGRLTNRLDSLGYSDGTGVISWTDKIMRRNN